MNEMQNFFKDNNYLVVKNFLDLNMTNMFYNYCLMTVKTVNFKTTYDKKIYNDEYDGIFGDKQVPNSFCKYGDVLMDTLLNSSYKTISNYLDLDLVPTYTYWRLYFTGSDLKRHIDRNSCEISLTLNLGSNHDNLNDNDYNWGIWIETKEKESLEINLNPGDMLIYKGCEIEHWREPFQGLNQAQVFLHFNQRNVQGSNPLDGRPMLGLPSKYKNTRTHYTGE